MRVRVKRWVGGIYITFALSELPDMFLVSIFSIGIPILFFSPNPIDVVDPCDKVNC